MNLELAIRNLEHIDGIAEHIRDLGFKHVNLADKNGLPSVIIAAQMLREILPDLKFTLHYSMRNHTSRYPEVIKSNLKEFIADATNAGIEEILLVSGGKKPKFDTIEAAKWIKEQADLDISNIKFGCAYNPFLFGDALEEEKTRLKLKHDTGLFSSVWTQIGDHIPSFDTACNEIEAVNPDWTIRPALLIPTQRLLQRLEFRPWSGVILSEQYMAGINNATDITKKLLTHYQFKGLDPVIEMMSTNTDALTTWGQVSK